MRNDKTGAPRVGRHHRRGLAAVLPTLLLVAGCTVRTSDPEAARPAPLPLGSVFGDRDGSVAGYLRALGPRAFSFPSDHGPHPGFRSEWWYFVGNLATPQGRRFGFQLTFFRFAVAPPPAAGTPGRRSRWATRQVWMAHFAVTDVQARRFRAFERFSRGALGLAGGLAGGDNGDAAAGGNGGFRVWLDDWRAVSPQPGSLLPLRLLAAATRDEPMGTDHRHPAPVALDLTLSPGKPIVLQGDRGWSRKGPEPGNASYYYSLPRLPVTGAVTVESETYPVSGAAWLDREWSTSALSEDEVGWDWFALQLDEAGGASWELMLYRLRRADGTASPWSEGRWIGPDGSSQRIGRDEVWIEVLDHWRSSTTGTVYPAGWRLRLSTQELDLTVRPLLADQELDLSLRYWEGAVAVEGERAGRPVSGRGYVELTGYGDRRSERSDHSR